MSQALAVWVLCLFGSAGETSAPASPFPVEPPYLLIRKVNLPTSAGQPPTRLLAAMWSDGTVVRAATKRAGESRYARGRLASAELSHVICLVERGGLAAYTGDTALNAREPSEELWLRTRKVAKVWTVGQSDNDDDLSSAMNGIRDALLSAQISSATDIPWHEDYPATFLSRQPSSSSRPEPACPEVVNAPDLLARVNRSGAEAVARDVTGSLGTWQAVLRGVNSGQREWLRVAEALRPALDAGASEDLTASLAEALSRAPSALLSMAGTDIEGRRCPFTLPEVCGNYIAHDDDGARAREFLLRQYSAVKTVSQTVLAAKRQSCLDLIAKSQEQLELAIDPKLQP
jgi:hypothetical protein